MSLCCKHSTPGSTTAASFFKDGSPVQMDRNHQSYTAGEMTIFPVSVSDGGRYKCKFKDGTESDERELRVKGKKLSHCGDKSVAIVLNAAPSIQRTGRNISKHQTFTFQLF